METIDKLFKANKINYIVSVDDCFGSKAEAVERSEIIDQVVEDVLKYIPIIKSLGKFTREPELLLSLPDEIKRKMITEWVELLDDTELDLIIADSEKFQLISQKKSLTSFLEYLISAGCIKEFKTISTVDEAREFLLRDIITEWEPSEDNKVLWLIDRDFGGDGSENEGFELLKEFNQDDCKWNIGILATQNTEDIENEEQFNKFLDTVSDLSQSKNLYWKINKNFIDISSHTEFVKAISHGLKRNYNYKITNFLMKSMQEGIQLAGKEFKNLDQSTFNNIVLNFSNDEGVSLVDTLIRVLLVLTRLDLTKKINEKYEDIAKLIYDYENLAIVNNQEEFNNLSEVNDIRHTEKYNDFVNQHYYPVGFGDIFNINEEDFLLVSQPCDITIRGRGDRKTNNGLLLKIVSQQPNHNDWVPLNYFKTGKNLFVNLKESLQVDLDILDLCSMNSDGESKAKIICIESIELQDQHLYSKGLRAKLIDVLSRLKIVFDKRSSLTLSLRKLEEELTNNKSDHREEISLLFKNYNKMEVEIWENIFDIRNYQTDGEYIYFNVKRISRLDSAITTGIAFDYFSVNSRIGLPGDFAKEYKLTKYELNVKDPQEFFLKECLSPRQISVMDVRVSEEKSDAVVRNAIFETIKQLAPSVERSDINYQIHERVITMDSGVITIKIADTEHTCVIKNETLKLPQLLFFQQSALFMSVIQKKPEVLFSNNKFRRFYSGKRQEILNEEISFKKNEFEENRFVFDCNGEILLSIEASIEYNGDFIYEMNLKFEENTTLLETLLL